MNSVSERQISEIIQSGLMYGLQLFDSWLYDETKPFIHMQAIPTFDIFERTGGDRIF